MDRKSIRDFITSWIGRLGPTSGPVHTETSSGVTITGGTFESLGFSPRNSLLSTAIQNYIILGVQKLLKLSLIA